MASVLIVDDDPDSSEALVEMLRRSGHSVKHAPNAREGLAIVLATPPDVVVLDVRMPVMSGPEFLEVVRSYRRFVNLPIVLFTAHASDETRQVARDAGVMRIFIKGTDDFIALLSWINEKFPPIVSDAPPAGGSQPYL